MASILLLFTMMAATPNAMTPTAKSTIAASTSQSSNDGIMASEKLHKGIFVAYIILLLITAAVTYLVWWSGKRVQDAIQSDADARINSALGTVASLQTEAANAKAAQQRVELELAKQQERTAEAIRLAEQERIARLRIEERLAYRNVSAEQSEILKRELESLKGERITILTSGTQPEINQYAKRITDVLKEAGLDAIFQPALLPTSHTDFLFISGEARLNAAASVAAAFVNAGLSVGRIPLQKVPETNELQIIIGPKE